VHLVVGNCVVVRMFLLRARKIWGEKSEKQEEMQGKDLAFCLVILLKQTQCFAASNLWMSVASV